MVDDIYYCLSSARVDMSLWVVTESLRCTELEIEKDFLGETLLRGSATFSKSRVCGKETLNPATLFLPF